ncbi:hypothetical protein CPB84DRAFT_1781758 [Gymnopilus junonius]|uniref:Uncharacterized protein n=1 Tax=Gymnopilus junonius TaxID=109634 RepID=A0A9P5TMC6_GYMJU|nr:hypothetical protein CPB84DRAFT_1781758 [Gymnopilus junonius]
MLVERTRQRRYEPRQRPCWTSPAAPYRGQTTVRREALNRAFPVGGEDRAGVDACRTCLGVYSEKVSTQKIEKKKKKTSSFEPVLTCVARSHDTVLSFPAHFQPTPANERSDPSVRVWCRVWAGRTVPFPVVAVFIRNSSCSYDDSSIKCGSRQGAWMPCMLGAAACPLDICHTSTVLAMHLATYLS